MVVCGNVYCACVACSEDQYRCENTGLCISDELLCDGENSCGDWSDELNCSECRISAYLTVVQLGRY